MTQADVTMRQSVLRDHPPPMADMTHGHADISETRLQQSSREIRAAGLELEVWSWRSGAERYGQWDTCHHSPAHGRLRTLCFKP